LWLDISDYLPIDPFVGRNPIETKLAERLERRWLGKEKIGGNWLYVAFFVFGLAFF
jgi:hypothetical protein